MIMLLVWCGALTQVQLRVLWVLVLVLQQQRGLLVVLLHLTAIKLHLQVWQLVLLQVCLVLSMPQRMQGRQGGQLPFRWCHPLKRSRMRC